MPSLDLTLTRSNAPSIIKLIVQMLEGWYVVYAPQVDQPSPTLREPGVSDLPGIQRQSFKTARYDPNTGEIEIVLSQNTIRLTVDTAEEAVILIIEQSQLTFYQPDGTRTLIWSLILAGLDGQWVGNWLSNLPVPTGQAQPREQI